ARCRLPWRREPSGSFDLPAVARPGIAAIRSPLDLAPLLPLADAQRSGSKPVYQGQRKGKKGATPSRVSIHAALIWPITGVKAQPDPFATIDRARSTSPVSLVAAPDRNSNGVAAFTSPEGTLKTTFVPSSIRPGAAITTSPISAYFPAPPRALASSPAARTRP